MEASDILGAVHIAWLMGKIQCKAQLWNLINYGIKFQRYINKKR